jgi:hypothetical protein
VYRMFFGFRSWFRVRWRRDGLLRDQASSFVGTPARLPTPSEAFAYVLFKNCRDKWMVNYAYLRKHNKNKKATVPRYKKTDPSTFKHQNRWLNANTVNVCGGGWHLEVLKYFNTQMKAVQEFREKEEKDGYPNYTLVQNLIKINNNIKMDDDGDSVSKKQKREEAQPDKSAEVIDLMFIDK